jgi:hypothetical protein
MYGPLHFINSMLGRPEPEWEIENNMSAYDMLNTERVCRVGQGLTGVMGSYVLYISLTGGAADALTDSDYLPTKILAELIDYGLRTPAVAAACIFLATAGELSELKNSARKRKIDLGG